jgi:hypothetical protein
MTLSGPCIKIISCRVKNLLVKTGTNGPELHGECRIDGLKIQHNMGIRIFSHNGNGRDGNTNTFKLGTRGILWRCFRRTTTIIC